MQRPAAETFVGKMSRAGSSAMVQLVGELDSAAVPLLGRQLNEVSTAVIGTLTLDLAEVSFADSAAVGVLALIAGQRREAGLPVAVVAARPAIRRVAVLCGLGDLLATADVVQQRAPVD